MQTMKKNRKIISMIKVFSIFVMGLFCLGIVNAYAYLVEFDETRWVDFKIRGQLAYHYLDKRGGGNDDHFNYFEPTEAEFYAKGQVTPLLKFFTQWEVSYKELDLDGKEVQESDTKMKETGVVIPFSPEFNIRFGRIRMPVSRYHQRSDYTKLIPTDYFYRYDVYELTKERSGDLKLGFNKTVLNVREPGALFFGSTCEGIFRYYLGLYNQDHNNHKDFRYTARLVFTPTMLGFKPETSLKGTRGDTYLGRKDVLTIGLGYSKSKINSDDLYDLDTGPTLDNDIYAIDVTFEKKYGAIVPNFGAGYIKAEESHLGAMDQAQDSEFWWIQGQLLYDEKIGFGKPAIATRFERVAADDAYRNEDFTSDRSSISFNYYFQGYDAMIAFCLDHIEYKDGAEDYLKGKYEDSVTDGSLFFQFVF